MEITPEYWAQPYKIKYTHVAPDGTCWNVGSVLDGMVHVWTINAWGQYFRENIPMQQFEQNWKEARINGREEHL